MQTAKYRPSHPIVFVFDFSNEDMTVPEYDASRLVASNRSCVSIRTIAEVDGDVTVWLCVASDVDSMNAKSEVFSGQLVTPSGTLAIVSALNEKLLEIDTGKSETSLTVWVDNVEYPSNLYVGVH